MNIIAVASATLAAIGCDDARRILQREFRSHPVYSYFGVPGSVYEALLAASSNGRYFNGAIRGRFLHRRVSNAKTGGLRGES